MSEASEQQHRKTTGGATLTNDHEVRIRELEQQLRTIPYKLDLHAEQIRGDLRVQQTEVAGRLDRILDKMDTLATREYVYNRAWALLAILVAITGAAIVLFNFVGAPPPPQDLLPQSPLRPESGEGR